MKLLILLLLIICHTTAEAQTVAVATAAAAPASYPPAEANPIDAFYPPPPGATFVIPTERTGALTENPAATPSAGDAFGIRISAAKGCDTSCRKGHVPATAINHRNRPTRHTPAEKRQ
jgi:hypothetical protein